MTQRTQKTNYYDAPLPLLTDRAITPGCEWVFKGFGQAYAYMDGVPAYVSGGQIYRVISDDGSWKRCVSGDDTDAPYLNALMNFAFTQGPVTKMDNGLYQLIGEGVHDNPYQLRGQVLAQVYNDQLRHFLPRSLLSVDGLRAWFRDNPVYGLLFRYTHQRTVLIRRTELGLKWPTFTPDLLERVTE